MKTLYVLRHGQADPEGPSGPDFERSLTARGLGEAGRVGQYLSQRSKPPTLIVASSATRARQTAELCQKAHGDAAPAAQLLLIEDLYLAEPDAYIAELVEWGQAHDVVMVVGHNPGLEALIYVLTKRSEHLATASLVEIALGIGAWSELSGAPPGVGRAVDVFRP